MSNKRWFVLRAPLVRSVTVAAGLTGIALAAATVLTGGRCASGECLAPSPSATADGTASNGGSQANPPSENPAVAAKASSASTSYSTVAGTQNPNDSATSSGSNSLPHEHSSTPTAGPTPNEPPPSGAPSSGAPSSGAPSSGGHSAIRYIANGTDSAVAAVKALGYNVIDTSSTDRSTIDSFKAKVIIYTGYNKDTCQWNVPDATWHSQVLNLRDDANVVGWFLADEPHPYDNGKCTSSAAQIKARSDFLHANAPAQKAMIVVLDGSNSCGSLPEGCEYKFYNEAATHADLIGLDPYVCSTAHPSCDYSKITQRVQSAVANGVPLDKIMPVYQAFGGDGYYLMPTPAQETTLLQTWDSLAPAGGWAGEYTYEWSQASEPDGLSNHPQVQSVFATHNGV